MYPEDEKKEQSIINVASPANAAPMPAANYQISGPLAEHKPDTKLRDTAVDVGGSVAGKGIEGALFGGGPEGTFFEKGLWGLGKGAGAGSAYSAGWGSAMNPIAAAFKGPGTAAATSGAGAGLSAGMAAAAPWAIPALIGAKMFGLFNKGGSVGPLSPQYKEHGGEAEDPWDITRRHVQTSSTAPGGERGGYPEDQMSQRSKNMRVPYPGFMDFARMTSRNIWNSEAPMWEKIMMTGAIPVDYGMSKLKHAIHDKDYGLTRNAINYDDPMVLNPGEVHQSMLLGPLSDINYKNQGGDIVDQLSIPREVKVQMLLDQYKDMYGSAGLPTDPDTNMRSAMQEKAGSMPSARKRGRATWSDVWGALGNPLRGSDLLPAYLLGQLPAFKNQMIVTDSERNQGIPFGGPLSETKQSNPQSTKIEKKETIEYKN